MVAPRSSSSLLWDLVALLFLTVCIPAYHGQGIAGSLRDYDLVVATGNSLMFVKGINSNDTSAIFTTPVPLSVTWPREWRAKIISVVPDLHSNAIYFTVITRNSSSIWVHYLETNTTLQLYSSPSKSGVGSLSLYQSGVYWCNEQNKSVMRLPISNSYLNWRLSYATDRHDNKSTFPPPPELVFKDPNGTFESCVVHPVTGVIYYAMWDRSNTSKIMSFDLSPGNSENLTKTVVNNVDQPKGLHIANNELYWIDNPPGIYFNIERISLNNSNSRRELITKDQNQHPFALTALCSTKLYWTDMINKAVWEFHVPTKKNKIIARFGNSNGTPYGLAIIQSFNSTECEILNNVQHQQFLGQGESDQAYFSTFSTADTVALEKVTQKMDYPSTHSSLLNRDPDVTLCNAQETGICQNGAACIKLKSQLHCLCASGFSGPVCGAKLEPKPCDTASSWSSNTLFITSTIIMSTVITILLLVIGVQWRRLRKLSTKPKIRRRVVVSHRSDIDNNPSSSTVCEMIDIENCCNMNICETPCYERLGSFSAGTSGRTRRTSSSKEDKKCLLTDS